MSVWGNTCDKSLNHREFTFTDRNYQFSLIYAEVDIPDSPGRTPSYWIVDMYLVV